MTRMETTVGLRELRQQASELVRRVEAGEVITITVSGRPTAQLVPAARDAWRRYEDMRDLFAGREDPAWEADLAQVDARVTDAWPQA
jgi:prevent-host-death family protein